MAPVETSDRMLPSSVESERAVLGAVLLDAKAMFPAAEVLTPDDFYLEANREIFRAMLGLAEEETAIDIFTLREELRRRGREEQAGGPAYLAALTEGLPSRLNVGHYARTVREKASLRQMIQLATEVQTRCYGVGGAAGRDPGEGGVAHLPDRLARDKGRVRAGEGTGTPGLPGR